MVQVPRPPPQRMRGKDQVSLNLKMRAVHTQLSFFKMIQPNNPTTIIKFILLVSLLGDAAAAFADMSEEHEVRLVGIVCIDSLFFTKADCRFVFQKAIYQQLLLAVVGSVSFTITKNRQRNIAAQNDANRNPACRGVDEWGWSLALSAIVRLFFGVLYGYIPEEAAVFVHRDGEWWIKILKPFWIAKQLKVPRTEQCKDSIGARLRFVLARFHLKDTKEFVVALFDPNRPGGKTGKITKDTVMWVKHSLVQPNLPVKGAIELTVVH
jgi:hypothetical protein